MKKDFIEKQKKKLIAAKNEILESLAERNDQLSRLVADNEKGDDADIASDTIDRSLLNSLGEADQTRLLMIDRALDRITQGTYGVCLMCGTSIPEERLEAMPSAALCIECQTKEERRFK